MARYIGPMTVRCHEYEAWRAARQKRLDEIHDWDDPEFQRLWNEERPKPYNNGQAYAYRTWRQSIRRKSSELECDDLPWDKDMEDFVNALRDAGFTELVVTDESTALMRDLHLLVTLGCKVVGLCEITRTEDNFGEEETLPVQGIRVAL